MATPPDTLSKDDYQALGNVRREIWSNAVAGTGYGLISGLALHTGASLMNRYGLVKLKLSRNTTMLSVLAGGALGSFLWATKAGKSQVHNLHPVFQVGAHPKGEDFNYQRTIAQAKLEMQQKKDGVDMERLAKIQAIRRKTLQNSIERGQGLSDSHGGHWVENDDDIRAIEQQEKLTKMQGIRRKTLQNSIERGQGLSDSHGGHWVENDDDIRAIEQQEKLAKMQDIRRKTIQNSIERGQGLGDSHGGHWVDHNQQQPK